MAKKALPNKIYAWQNDKYMPVKSRIIAMEDNQDNNPEHVYKSNVDYNANENAQNIARLFMYSLPSNTLDILLDSIANDLIKVYKDNPDFVFESFDIQNRIRGTLQDLCQSNKMEWKDKPE